MRWLIAHDDEGFYAREVLRMSLDLATNQGTYVTRLIPGTYANLDDAVAAVANDSDDD